MRQSSAKQLGRFDGVARARGDGAARARGVGDVINGRYKITVTPSQKKMFIADEC